MFFFSFPSSAGLSPCFCSSSCRSTFFLSILFFPFLFLVLFIFRFVCMIIFLLSSLSLPLSLSLLSFSILLSLSCFLCLSLSLAVPLSAAYGSEEIREKGTELFEADPPKVRRGVCELRDRRRTGVRTCGRAKFTHRATGSARCYSQFSRFTTFQILS